MRKRTRRTGVRLALALLAGSLVFAAGDGKKGKEAPFGLVSGTVFRDNGLSLPGADVALFPAAAADSRKPKKIRVVTDARGEFAIRVPAGPADYRLVVAAAGYQTQEKSVRIAGEDRVDVFIRLEAASK